MFAETCLPATAAVFRMRLAPLSVTRSRAGCSSSRRGSTGQPSARGGDSQGCARSSGQSGAVESESERGGIRSALSGVGSPQTVVVVADDGQRRAASILRVGVLGRPVPASRRHFAHYRLERVYIRAAAGLPSAKHRARVYSYGTFVGAPVRFTRRGGRRR